MKRTVLIASLVFTLVVAIPVFARNRHCEGIKTHPHQVYGVLEGTFLFVPFPDAATPFEVDALGHTSGVVRGLGHANMFNFQRPALDGSGDITNGLVKIVVTHRDVLQGQYVGTTVYGQEPDQLIGNADIVITGGTGRFANASGTIHMTAYATMLGFDVLEWPVTFVLEGTVEY